MKKFICLTLLIIFVFACEFSAGKAVTEKAVSEPKYTIKSDHPRLYLTQERLQDIRKRCSDRKGAQAKYYSVLKEFADKFVSGKSKPSINDCFALAFVYAVGEVSGYDYSRRSVADYGKLGADLLTKLSPPEDLDYFKRNTPLLIAAYDWLFPVMTSEQRAAVFNNFTAVADKMRAALGTSIGGRFRETREMYAYYGLAFFGDGRGIYPSNAAAAAKVDKKAREYSNFFALWQRDENLAILEATCKGGGFPAGTMYGEAPYPGKLWAIDAWGTASDNKLYNNTTAMTGYPLFWLYMMLPYPTHVRYDNANGRIDQPGGIVRFGDYRYIGHTAVAGAFNNVNIAQAQGVAARQGRSELAAVFNWLVQYQGEFKPTSFGGPFPTNKSISVSPQLVWDIIFRDGLVQSKSPIEAALPLAHHFGSINTATPFKPDFQKGRPEGAGVVVMRSSWNDPSGTLVWFKASSTPYVHDHRDQGSFQIYKKGWLAIDSGQYEETPHRGNYTSRTVAHNSLLVYRPGESLKTDKADPVWYGFANDGGQRWIKPPGNAKDVESKEYFMGGVTSFKTVPRVYDYVNADITRSYNSLAVTSEGHEAKVSDVTRSILFLRPDEFIVVLDHVAATKVEYPKRWLLHSIYRPELNGMESFQGTVPFSTRIPGKLNGMSLQGNKDGGISESRNTDIFTIKGWDFGPSDGRLVVRTILPQNHITRLVGGSDKQGVRKTALAKPYDSGDSIYVRNASGFAEGDFVYLGETDKPYSEGKRGHPNWLVDDVYYQGWGKIKSVDPGSGRIMFVAYRHGIPKLPEGAVVIRSGHANRKSYEFMDAEYNQWQMYGEAVANAGPYIMQHGNWRVEVEPIDQKKDDIFLHVMLPCEITDIEENMTRINKNVTYVREGEVIKLELKGKTKTYTVKFNRNTSGVKVKIVELGKVIYDDERANDGM